MTTINYPDGTTILADVREGLKRLPSESVDCVITSPPYWNLRNYGFAGQWGLEKTFEEYIEKLWLFMDDIHRVLKPSGTVFINLGDSYGGSGNRSGHTPETTNPNKITFEYGATNGNQKFTKGYEKCLLMIPSRFALGMIDGTNGHKRWTLRNDLIWNKVNGIPESVTDRWSKKHEHIFFFVKDAKNYYFDLDAIREKHKESSVNRYGRGNADENKYNSEQTSVSNLSKPRKNIKHDIALNRNGSYDDPLHNRPYNLGGKNPGDCLCFWEDYKDLFSLEEYLELAKEYYLVKGDAWQLTTKANKSSHYATYNSGLIGKPLIAGTPEEGIVLDPFAGTFTTAMTAIKHRRKFIMIEASEEYYKIGTDNLNEHYGLFREVI